MALESMSVTGDRSMMTNLQGGMKSKKGENARCKV